VGEQKGKIKGKEAEVQLIGGRFPQSPEGQFKAPDADALEHASGPC
jgi:hypothetical protein